MSLRALALAIAIVAFGTTPAVGGAAWSRDAVVYGIVPQLCGPRGLADITERLDAIAALGANVLWLTPITDAPHDDFGYAVTDHFRVRPAIGSADDLRHLIDAAHQRGLKIVLDIAANDLSARHPFYQDTLARGRASPYWDFFVRDAAGAATHYFDWTELENLNFDDPAVGAYVTEAFAYWLRGFGVDGFRIDAAWGPRERTPAFWPRWEQALHRLNPEALLIAEGSERDPYYAAAGFDAAYDWTDRPGEWAWSAAFADPHPAPRLAAALAAERDHARILHFLDNNDTGARFITRHGPEMTRVAMAMLLTLPGIPALFMGEEVGAAFDPYGEARPIAWDDPHHLLAATRRLVALRRAEPALRGPELQLIATNHDDAVLAYYRPPVGAAPGEGSAPQSSAHGRGVLVLLNFTDAALSVAPAEEQIMERLGRAAEDLIGGGRFDLDTAHREIRVPALSALILAAVRE